MFEWNLQRDSHQPKAPLVWFIAGVTLVVLFLLASSLSNPDDVAMALFVGLPLLLGSAFCFLVGLLLAVGYYRCGRSEKMG